MTEKQSKFAPTPKLRGNRCSISSLLGQIYALHGLGVEHLRAGGFGENVRREAIFDDDFGKRLEFGTIDRICECKVTYLAFRAVLDLAEVDVHIFCLLLADAVEEAVNDALKILRRLERALP